MLDFFPPFTADQLVKANIMPQTGLATDYLNVFNEAVMLFGMLADMPDMIDDLRDWEMLSYEEHFRRSGFQAKELAIAAYQSAPDGIRRPFDHLSHKIGAMIKTAVVEAEARISQDQPLDDFVPTTSMAIQAAIMELDGMVHGGHIGGDQDDIDALFGADDGADDGGGAVSQDDIDALFD